MKNPSYYINITSDVRYDSRITAFQKLLFSEILALTNKEGYCWASNSYFAKLYDKNPNYISGVINDLAKKGYIIIEVNKDEGNFRKICIAIQKNLNSYSEKPEYPYSEKPEENIIKINNKNNIKNNREENSRNLIEKKFSKREEITQTEIQDLSAKYKCPESLVWSCWDSVQNWLDAEGKTKKNYKAFLDNWIKRELKPRAQSNNLNGRKVVKYDPNVEY